LARKLPQLHSPLHKRRNAHLHPLAGKNEEGSPKKPRSPSEGYHNGERAFFRLSSSFFPAKGEDGRFFSCEEADGVAATFAPDEAGRDKTMDLLNAFSRYAWCADSRAPSIISGEISSRSSCEKIFIKK
jgi:hypothetical protein